MVDHKDDIETVLSHRYANGTDFWAGADDRIYVGNPYSTISSLVILHELGIDQNHEAVQGGLDLILKACRDDGKIRLAPKAPLYPCYTAEAARVLCRYGLHQKGAIDKTIGYFMANAHQTGGWRCSFTRMGKGPETTYANPGATLNILDVLRFVPDSCDDKVVAEAIELLLAHWEIRKPIGPCHWGIGSLFMQVEFPFLRYNLFYYVYVLSFFKQARNDKRFLEAFAHLQKKLDENNQLVVERPHRGLKELKFCQKNQPSIIATRRYQEICSNIDDIRPTPNS